MSKQLRTTTPKSAKTGPLYTPLERYDPAKHSDLELPIQGGILSGWMGVGRAEAFRLAQQQAKFSDACTAMGISAGDKDAGDRLLAMFCAEKWPKGFKERPEKKDKPLTRKQQASRKKRRDAFNLFLHLAGPVHTASGKVPEVKAVAEAILKGGSDKFSSGVDVSSIFRRPDVPVTTYKGKYVRAIPAPTAGRKAKTFFDAIATWAQSNGVTVLDYLSLEGTGHALSAKGSLIARFIPPAAISALAKRADAQAGDAMFFIADASAQRAAQLAAMLRSELGTRLGVNFNQFAGLRPTNKYGKTLAAVLGNIYRGGEENHWQPLTELELWGHEISTLTANSALNPLDTIADYDEPLTIIGNRKCPIGWSIYRRLFNRGANVDLGTDVAQSVLAEFETLVGEAEKEKDARGKHVNRAGLVLIDASFHENDYVLKVQQHLAECGLYARIVKNQKFCFPLRAPIVSPISGLPLLPRLGGCPFYLINLRDHVPPELLAAGKSDTTQDTWRATSHRARKRAESVRDFVEAMPQAEGEWTPYSGPGMLGLLGGRMCAPSEL